jgi:hypothetical protein
MLEPFQHFLTARRRERRCTDPLTRAATSGMKQPQRRRPSLLPVHQEDAHQRAGPVRTRTKHDPMLEPLNISTAREACCQTAPGAGAPWWQYSDSGASGGGQSTQRSALVHVPACEAPHTPNLVLIAAAGTSCIKPAWLRGRVRARPEARW